MPEVVSSNPDGTFTVRRDDGRDVRTAFLPPGLAAPPRVAPAPEATPEDLDEAEVLEVEAQAAAPAAPALPKTPEAVVAGLVQQDRAVTPQMTELAVRKVGESPMGFEPTAPKGLEFNGFRGDPAVVQRTSDGKGWENAGPAGASGHGPVGREARSDIGGAPPLLAPRPDTEGPLPGMRVEDFALASPPMAPNPAAPQQTAGQFMAQFGFKPAAPGAGKKALDEAYKMQMAAVGERAALEEQKAAGDVARLEELDRGERERQAQAAERQQVANRATEEARSELSSLYKSLEEPSGQLDPSRWWNSRTTGQKIMAYASAFLSGFAGTANPIQQYIQDDINAQRYNLDRADKTKGARIEGAKTMLAVARERFGDELLADSAARSAAAENAMRLADVATAKYQQGDAGVKRSELLATLAQQKAQADADFEARSQALALKAWEANAKFMAQQKVMAQQLLSIAAEGGRAVDVATLTEEQRKRAVVIAPGRAVLALNEKAATKMQDLSTAARTTDGLLTKIIELRRQFGPETLNQAAVKSAKSLRASLLFQIKNLEETGALDKGTMDVVEPMVPEDPLAWSIGVADQLEQTRDNFRQRYATAYRQYIGYEVPRANAPAPAKK